LSIHDLEHMRLLFDQRSVKPNDCKFRNSP
jgi:hypothetical protein